MNINEKEFRKFLAELRKRLMAAGVKKEVIETAVAEAIIAREEKIQETITTPQMLYGAPKPLEEIIYNAPQVLYGPPKTRR